MLQILPFPTVLAHSPLKFFQLTVCVTDT